MRIQNSLISISLTIFILILSTGNVCAQLAGQVVDSVTMEPLAGANVYLSPSGKGLMTDSDGYFRFSAFSKNSTDTLIVNFLGYKEFKILARMFKHNTVIYLAPRSLQYEDSMIVRGDVIDLPKKEIPHAKQQMTLREIEQYGTGEIADLFKTFSSVRLVGNDIDGRSIQIRGSDADEVNVYIDGVLINNLGFDNSADLSIIPTESVENLEVLKGSNLTLLGRGAFGGVVNITTKRRFEKSVGLRIKRGSFESKYFIGEANLPLSSKFYVNYYGQINSFYPEIEYFPGERFSPKSEGENIKTEKENHHINFNYFTETSQLNAKFIGYFLNYEKPFWENKRNNYLGAISYNGHLWWLKDFDLNINYFHSDDNLNRNPIGSARYLSDYTTDRLNAKFIKKFIYRRTEIHFLAEYFHDQLKDELRLEDQGISSALYHADLYENRGSVGGVVSFSDTWENSKYVSYKTFIGVRGDFVANGQNDLSWTFGFQLDYNKLAWKVSTYTNLGKNVKYPTLFENAYLQDITEGSLTDSTFTRIKPEYNNSAEIGINLNYMPSFSVYKRIEVDFAVFRSTTFNRLIQRPFDNLIAYFQTGRNVTKGLETSLKFHQIFKYFNIAGSYTGLDIADPLLYPYRPELNLSTQLDINTGFGIYITGRYFYEGESVGWYYDIQNNFQTVDIPSFYDIDVTFGYKVNIQKIELHLQLSGYNILDNSGYQYYYLKKRYLQISFAAKYL